MAFGLLGGALLAYLLARESSMFAVRTVRVEGATPGIAREVERTLAATRGQSLLAVDLAAVARSVEEIPTVAAVGFDRAFPHTLRVTIVPEHSVAVVRQGADAYLVSARGRVMGLVARRGHRHLARIWVPKGVTLSAGALLDGDLATAVRAVSPLAGARFPSRVTSVEATAEELTLHLRSGLEVRLGDATRVDLKLAVARVTIPLLQPSSLYLDVSVPERPVGGTTLYSQVEGETGVSTTP